MALNGYTDELNGYNTVIKNGVNADANYAKAVLPPIGTVLSWLKTFGTADSGTTDSTTANKLIQSGQNFQTTVTIGMIVKNTTDDTFSYVTAVDSDTQLTLADDIMVSGETYTIYKTPYLPDGWVECNGQTLSDADSPFNGQVIPDLNVTQRFLRGNSTSGGTGGADTIDLSHTHSVNSATQNNSYNGSTGYLLANSRDTDTQLSSAQSILPPYYEVVWVMRIK